MSGVDTGLPEGFEPLEPFAATWAVAGAARRARLRLDSAPEEREAFSAPPGTWPPRRWTTWTRKRWTSSTSVKNG